MDLSNDEVKYKLLAENITDVVYINTLDGQFAYISPSVKNMSGYEPNELIGAGVDKILTPESYQAQKMNMQKALAEKNFEQPAKLAMQAVKKDGTRFWIEIHAKFIQDPQGNIQGIIGVARDISDRIQIEQQLQQKVAELEKMVNLTVDRELKMVELKQENDRLKEQLNSTATD